MIFFTFIFESPKLIQISQNGLNLLH
jgi:hypothetical protein